MIHLRATRPWPWVFFLALGVPGCGANRAAEPAPAAPASSTTETTEERASEKTPASGFAAPPSGTADEAAPRSSAPAAGAPAASAPSSMTKAEAESLQTRKDELDTLGGEFERALSLSSGGDCSTPWALRDRICDLAQRLCDIAERSAEPDVQERCKDGRARCERATTRARAACAD